MRVFYMKIAGKIQVSEKSTANVDSLGYQIMGKIENRS